MKQTIDVAAYIWPSYTGSEPRTRIFWPEGIGEWETVMRAKPKFDGHLWPRKPLWGYEDEAVPAVMEKQIREAVSHGVNVFIYDWYWYDGRPFLEQCLNNGFLGASNNREMKFYLMWANHDANYLWDRRNASKDDITSTVVWRGATTASDFQIIVKRWLDQYLTLPNYYVIDGKPVVAIYDIPNFINTFGSIDATREAMEWANDAAKEYGLSGIHFQAIQMNYEVGNLSGIDSASTLTTEDLIAALPFSSMTNYQYVHLCNVNRRYADVMPDVRDGWKRNADAWDMPYFPHVSLGWDNNPRHTDTLKPDILTDNTPDEIEKALADAKSFAEQTGVSLVTINSWNEWTVGSYLEPDDLYGYGYLDAVKRVFAEE